MSSRSREVRGGAVRKISAQGKDDVRISVQSPTPGSSPEPDISGKGHGSAGAPSGDMAGSEEEWSGERKLQEGIPAILRPGYVADERDARAIKPTEEVVRSDTSFSSEIPDRMSATDTDGADLSLCAGKAAKKTRVYCQEPTAVDAGSVDSVSTSQLHCNPDALMDDWRMWSEGWEKCVTRVNSRANRTSDNDRSHCDPDALMQEWREWSTKWERLVTSR